jgi:hypothetical protein
MICLMSRSVRFIRQTLAVCLLLYGCERNALISTQMIIDGEVKDLPSRRVSLTIIRHAANFWLKEEDERTGVNAFRSCYR